MWVFFWGLGPELLGCILRDRGPFASGTQVASLWVFMNWSTTSSFQNGKITGLNLCRQSFYPPPSHWRVFFASLFWRPFLPCVCGSFFLQKYNLFLSRISVTAGVVSTQIWHHHSRWCIVFTGGCRFVNRVGSAVLRATQKFNFPRKKLRSTQIRSEVCLTNTCRFIYFLQ